MPSLSVSQHVTFRECGESDQQGNICTSSHLVLTLLANAVGQPRPLPLPWPAEPTAYDYDNKHISQWSHPLWPHDFHRPDIHLFRKTFFGKALCALMSRAHILKTRSKVLGNPRMYWNFLDESLNGILARVCRGLHRQSFYLRPCTRSQINWSMSLLTVRSGC